MEMIKTEQYREAAAYLASRIEGNPETAIILGSGLGSSRSNNRPYSDTLCGDPTFYEIYRYRA